MQLILLCIFQLYIFTSVRSYEEYVESRTNKRLANPSGKKISKRKFCCDFITGYVKTLNPIVDTHGITTVGNEAEDMLPVYELPFRGVLCFYKEFVSHCVDKGFSESKLPTDPTFRRAMKDISIEKYSKKDKGYECHDLKERKNQQFELRYLRCKGSHASCEVCLNASAILDDRSIRFGPDGRQVVRKHRTLHLQQQAEERNELTRSRECARKRECVFLMGDFMSEYATKVPIIHYKGQTSKEDSSTSNTHMGLALYGIEVIYGNIECIFCYLIPGFVSHGMYIVLNT